MVYAIEVEGLTKSFGEVEALAGVDLMVKRGEIHGLLGPNGAGKSTLLRVLFGLVRADSGRAALFGREHDLDGTVATLSEVGGFVDRPSFYPYLTARRTLQLLARVDGTGPRAPIDEVLEATGLQAAADRRLSGWSTGMLQRLGIASALLRRPRMLLLDEPTEGLDPVGSRELDALLRRVAAGGTTILLSSHDMSEVDSLCDRATILHHGSVVREGLVAHLRQAAPEGRHRMRTSDDAAALRLASRLQVSVSIHPQGGLTLQVGPDQMHLLVCALGCADVSVTLLVEEVAPLTALFYDVTEAMESPMEPAGL